MTATNDRAAAEWLRRLNWALAAMPPPDREDIVAEARAHIEEAAAEGRATTEVLAGFGAPDAYARRFLEEMELSAALGSGRVGRLFVAVARRVHQSLIAFAAFVVVLCVAGLAGGAALAAVWKLFDPVHVGLWLSPRFFFIGQIDDPSTGRELLGLWLYPFTCVVLVLAWIICRFVLVRTLRMLSRPL